MGVEMIAYGDFVEVTSERLKDAGMEVGDRLFIAGSKAIPEYKEDPYILRLKFLVCRLDAEGHIISEKFIMVDPRNIKKVSKTQQKKLTMIMKNDFEGKKE